MSTERVRRVLVTGASGFLGRNILRALATRSDLEVIAACRRAEGLPATFRGERRIGDLLAADYRAEVVRGIDVICHAAPGARCGATPRWSARSSSNRRAI